MEGIKDMLAELMKATYKESNNMEDAIIEDFGVNLNPFLRPAHFQKAKDAAAKGDELSAFVHTIEANPILPPIPSGLIDTLRKEGKIPEPERW